MQRNEVELESPSRENIIGGKGTDCRNKRIVARPYNSGFALSHDTYNALSITESGKVYYVLCSETCEAGAQMYCYDPGTKAIRHVGDLTEACGEAGLQSVPQGKSHVRPVECNGRLYLATHLGYYSIVDGLERHGIPPSGLKPYKGGHFLAYDICSGEFEDLARAPDQEGIQSMSMDTRRGRLYGHTWPSGYFLRYDLAARELRNLGQFSGQGEGGQPPMHRSLCRSLAVDPEDGSVYFTTLEGSILRYDYETDAIETLLGEDMKKDYFGNYDATVVGHAGYHWRQTLWYAPEKAIYGVHSNSGYLFRFDPRIPRVEVLDRITSEPSKRIGMYDQAVFGYLGFTLGPDGHTIYYLTGAPIFVDGKRIIQSSDAKFGSKGEENLHLITYHIPTSMYSDWGPVFFENGQRPSYVQTAAVAGDGTIYAISRITENNLTRGDLISIAGPLK